jgi:hypothetical protein
MKRGYLGDTYSVSNLLRVERDAHRSGAGV